MQKYCFFYINSESSYETCGERRDIGDVPQIVIVRYKRDTTRGKPKVERKPKTIWDSYQEDDENLASQLVAKYNGSTDISEVFVFLVIRISNLTIFLVICRSTSAISPSFFLLIRISDIRALWNLTFFLLFFFCVCRLVNGFHKL